MQPHLRTRTALAGPYQQSCALQPAARALGHFVLASVGTPAAGFCAEVQQGGQSTGFSVHPAAGDACLHLAAVPGARCQMGPTRQGSLPAHAVHNGID